MGGVVKEWKCLGHGPFEGCEPVCPHGCSTVERIFLTAPGLVGKKTKSTDRLTQQLADDFKVTDFNNKNKTQGARVLNTKAMQEVETFQKEVRKRFPQNWGGVPAGGTLEVGTGHIRDQQRGAGMAAQAHTVAVGDTTAQAPKRPTVRIRDPQNLQVQK